MVNLLNSYMYSFKSHPEPWWNCHGLDWRSSSSSIHACISSRHESSTMVNLLGSWQAFSINSYMYFFMSRLEPWWNCQGFERHSSSIHTCIFSRVILNHDETVKSWHIFHQFIYMYFFRSCLNHGEIFKVLKDILRYWVPPCLDAMIIVMVWYHCSPVPSSYGLHTLAAGHPD